MQCSIHTSLLKQTWRLVSNIIAVGLPLLALLADHQNSIVVILWLALTCVLNIICLALLISDQAAYLKFLNTYFVFQFVCIFSSGGQKFAWYAMWTFLYNSIYITTEAFIDIYGQIKKMYYGKQSDREIDMSDEVQSSEETDGYELVSQSDGVAAPQA